MGGRGGTVLGGGRDVSVENGGINKGDCWRFFGDYLRALGKPLI